MHKRLQDRDFAFFLYILLKFILTQVGRMEKIGGVGAYSTAIIFQQCRAALRAKAYFPKNINIA